LLFWPQSSYQFFKNVPDARLAREDTKEAFLVVRSANAVAEAIQDAERGQRGYLITGRESYLEPYNSAKEHLPQLLGILQQASPTGRSSNAGCSPSRAI
jgi:CHASE3 domain sensor protein